MPKRKKRRTIAPPITRVHRLHRIRTIVRDGANLDRISQQDVGKILVQRKLSMPSILQDTDHMRRARDHLANALYLGLLDRQKLGEYILTPYGQLLTDYDFADPCPKNSKETAIFIDRLLRLKLTNPYDTRQTYRMFRSRIFLSILFLLDCRSLHLSQIHYSIGKKDDLIVRKDLAEEILEELSPFTKIKEGADKAFKEEFGLDDKRHRREIGRSTKPLVDWCRQAGLVTRSDGDWYDISEHGRKALGHYCQLFPIWYNDLGFDPVAKAALLLAFDRGNNLGKLSNPEGLDDYFEEVLKELVSLFPVFTNRNRELERPLDFDFFYDVPFHSRDEVMVRFNEVSKQLGLGKVDSMDFTMRHIDFIHQAIQETRVEIELKKLMKTIGLYIPPRHTFQTELEWQVCVRLLSKRYPASPYNGEFEGVYNPRISARNPDILIRDGICSLVEVKSSKEWGSPVRFDKRVLGEISVYQQYATSVSANSALFVCETESFEEEAFDELKEVDYTKIILTTYDFLQKLDAPRMRGKFNRTLKRPEDFSLRQRVFDA